MIQLLEEDNRARQSFEKCRGSIKVDHWSNCDEKPTRKPQVRLQQLTQTRTTAWWNNWLNSALDLKSAKLKKQAGSLR